MFRVVSTSGQSYAQRGSPRHWVGAVVERLGGIVVVELCIWVRISVHVSGDVVRTGVPIDVTFGKIGQAENVRVQTQHTIGGGAIGVFHLAGRRQHGASRDVNCTYRGLLLQNDVVQQTSEDLDKLQS